MNPASHVSRVLFLSVITAATSHVANAQAVAQSCRATSDALATPVIELYTSEGCSSCPSADKWLSQLPEVRSGKAVALAFHVDYWDYIGWKDRFASPQYSARQHEGAASRNSRQIYTPQVVVNGQDFRWSSKSIGGAAQSAKVKIELSGIPQGESVALSAKLTPLQGAPSKLAAYWAVTEDMHVSKVTAGENARETLKHDYVVRQYLPVAAFNANEPPALRWTAPGVNVNATAQHKQRVHLIVTDAATGAPLQAATLDTCS
jgi:hypothetical protein